MRFDGEDQLQHLADHECEHGYMPDDVRAKCACWGAAAFQEHLAVLANRGNRPPVNDPSVKSA